MSAGPVDEDTARAVQAGRETLGALLSTVQARLKRAFIAFVIGLLLGILAMRRIVWPALRADLLDESAEIVVLTPFDVILLQVKIGLIVGILFAIPTVVYYSRHSLRERGVIRDVPVSRWRAIVVATLAVLLFLGGALYAYYLFFPIMFSFLANNATQAGFAPRYSIVAWTQFILVLGLSFGLAAQLPLAMSALAYSGVVPYETFRDKWKYAIVLIFVFGAIFSPPDPFTQIMWAAPLVALYGFSLYLTKIVVRAKRGRASLRVKATLARRWNRIAGVALLAGGGAYAFVRLDAVTAINERVLPGLPAWIRPGPLREVSAVLGLSPTAAGVVLGAVGALVAGVLTSMIVLYRSIDTGPGHPMGTPAGIDIGELDAAGIRAAPIEAFAQLSEEETVEHARAALQAGDTEKAQALVDRLDELDDFEAAEPEPTEDADETGGINNAISRTTSGMLGAFTEDEDAEEEIGGYYYDIRFVFGSLRSRMFRVFAVFFAVLATTFYVLYSGGIGVIRRDFLARLPETVRPEEIEIVTLHPVEALVFEVKISTLIAFVAIIPMILYYAWPALRERGLIKARRRIISIWAASVVVALVVGSAIGYAFVAPTVISWLVWDALQANMVIAYRVNNFFWLVFLTTVGVGILFAIPMTMVVFHLSDVVSYRRQRWAWRGVALAAFVLAAVVTPDSLYTMLLIGIPIVIFYWVGLILLWVITLGGRRTKQPQPGTAR